MKAKLLNCSYKFCLKQENCSDSFTSRIVSFDVSLSNCVAHINRSRSPKALYLIRCGGADKTFSPSV